MNARQDAAGRILILLKRGEPLRASILLAARDAGVDSGRISGIGALEDPELGWFDLEKKDYERRTFPGLWELLSRQGNLTRVDGDPFLHVHVALAGRGFEVRGGHLFDAAVGVVAASSWSRWRSPSRGSPGTR